MIILDFIELAVKAGIDKDKAVSVYRRLNGGYYMKIYYSKSPILFSLVSWPNLYLRSRKFYPKLAEPGYSEAVQLLISVDVISVVGMSSVILSKPLPLEQARKDIEKAFSAIRDDATANSIYPYPEEGEVKITQDFFAFISDLVRKRKEDDSRDIMEVLNDMAYDSEALEEVKKKYPWAKTVNRADSLKALGLAGKLDEFLKTEEVKLAVLMGQRNLHIDRLLVERGITETVKLLSHFEELDPSFVQSVEGVKRMVLEVSNYV
ncbi:hypothetical protein L3N51_00755 [Metallosphaera sp. J1]|uniref:hypothetical protein n=1 Tax=Metallosphaera TaxID=41980 RepID=UPI001EE08272|nr:hypothetical protein [Metallosphaera javensis (ex Hofmann et al. 2022)]MCG3108474.1 hypothetical protein [Metallosphaera javensis (ex Hofmann et al. 2022)]BCS92866.1 MAG: hypothetical protein MjAS7_1474 [Metallosphaera javensis (ex Sakai et al. 2022)]